MAFERTEPQNQEDVIRHTLVRREIRLAEDRSHNRGANPSPAIGIPRLAMRPERYAGDS